MYGCAFICFAVMFVLGCWIAYYNFLATGVVCCDVFGFVGLYVTTDLSGCCLMMFVFTDILFVLCDSILFSLITGVVYLFVFLLLWFDLI